mmetsp:Transcript_42794/g.96612  ORF Transcript_42794/g.96612 Transcript_42794/m.96612 type:complete len:336 (-) Transcript_42794:217-1224(-)
MRADMALAAEACGGGHGGSFRIEAGTQCDEDSIVKRLEREKEELQQRLEFVEELVGPTEAQRKSMQEQVLAARSAALKAKYRGASVPTKVAGRLDERLMWASGLSERDAGLLQGGCLPDNEGILQDVSLLGDPNFRPYDQQTGELRWHARGGVLQLSLGEVRSRFGDDIARDVVRCAKELDKYDGSRRVGIELPWHPLEDRELEPAEIINLMDRELSLQSNLLYPDDRDLPHVEGVNDHHISPYAVVNAPPRRGRGRHGRTVRIPGGPARSARGARSGSAGAPPGSSAVVPLPRVESTRRAPEMRCAMPSMLRHPRAQDTLEHPLLGCHERIRLC